MYKDIQGSKIVKIITMYVHTVVQEIFVFRNFRGKNFRVKIFLWSGGYHEIYYHENLYTLCNYVEKMEDYKRDLYVRSFHMYRDIWEAAVGEVLDCEREPGNAKDRYRSRAILAALSCVVFTYT